MDNYNLISINDVDKYTDYLKKSNSVTNKLIGYATWIVRVKTEFGDIVKEYGETEKLGLFHDIDDFKDFIKQCNREEDVHRFPCSYNGYDYDVEVSSYHYSFTFVDEDVDWRPVNQLTLLRRAMNNNSTDYKFKKILDSAINEYMDLEDDPRYK